MKRKIWMLVLILGFHFGIHAALLTFSDGSKLEGKIKDAKEDRIIIETEFGDIERMRSEIFSMTDLSAEETTLVEKNTFAEATSAESSTEKPAQTEDSSMTSAEPENEAEASEPASDLPLPLNIPPVEPVKSLTLSSTLSTLEESDSNEDSNDLSEIEQSAYNSLLLLKTKLSKNFESRQSSMIQSFEKERLLLEKNLRDLTQKYNALKQSSQEKDLQISALSSQLGQYKEQQIKSENSIVNFKKQLQELEEKTVKAEINRTEDIKNALTKNKELLNKEKQALTESYEGQVAELKKQLETSSQRALELAAANSSLSEKLSASEKNHELTQSALAAKEKELEAFKADIKKQFGEFSEKTSSDKSTIEKTLVSSAETLAHLREYNSKLNDENSALKEQCSSQKKDIQALKEDVEYFEKERDQYKKDLLEDMDSHRIFKKKTKKRQEKLLQSLVENAMVETQKENPPADTEFASGEKPPSSAEGQTFEPSRLEILNLMQEDMKELNSKLQTSQKSLLKSEKEKSHLKTDLKEAQDQIRFMLSEQKQAEEKARQIEKEKTELKKQLENLIKDIREEARQNIEKQKEEFKKQFDDSLKNFEQKNMEATIEPPPDMKNSSAEDALFSTEEALPLPSSSEIEKSLASPARAEPPPEEEPAPTKIEVGHISQIETDLRRVFIDTKEKIKKGDLVFVQTEQGEVPFKIITVYDDSLMKGAIAEIKNRKLLSFIKLNDPAYIK